MHSSSDLQTILITICNNVYSQKKSYEVTVIDKNPDSMIVDRVSKLPYCSHNRHYTADNLNHDVFIIYY